MAAKFLVSTRFDMNIEDWKKVGKNALIFLGPALLVLLASTMSIVPKDWQYAGIALWCINVAVDLLRKYLTDNTK